MTLQCAERDVKYPFIHSFQFCLCPDLIFVPVKHKHSHLAALISKHHLPESDIVVNLDNLTLKISCGEYYTIMNF